MFNPNRPYVPYTFPEVSFLKLQDYITNLVNQYGGVYWPLDDVANNPYNRVINTAVAVGRELVVDPGFNDATKWIVNTNWSVAAGVANANAVTALQFIVPTPGILQLGRVYTVTYTVVVTSGSVIFQCGSTSLSTARSASGTYTETLLCTGNTTLGFRASTGTFTGTIDNVSCKELNIPAYNATPSQLLNTDVWNGLGVGAWTAGASATLSAQTTTRHDGVSGTVLRIARNGSANPYASMSISSVNGVIVRVYGWARSDGSAVPIIRFPNAGTTFVTLTNSTDWQPFDFLMKLDANSSPLFSSSTNTGTQYTEWDVSVVALDTGIRTDSPGVNLNFENWSSSTQPNSWVKSLTGTSTVNQESSIIHGGSSALRFDIDASNSSIILTQNMVNIGKRYLISLWAKSDAASGVSMLISSTSGAYASFSLTSTYTQYSVVITANAVALQLKNNAATSHSIYIDDITITELSPLVGLPVNGAVLGNSEAPLRIGTSVSFDGVNDLINLYSVQLNSVFPTDEGAIGLFAKSSIWTAGTVRTMIVLVIDANNFWVIRRTATANQFEVTMRVAGVDKQILQSSFSPSTFFSVVLNHSVSGNKMEAFVNGASIGSLSGITAILGNLSTTQAVAGANSTAAASPHSGSLTQIFILNSPLSTSEIAEISKLGDAS